MTALTLIRRSIVYHRRTHLGVLLGTALSTAIIVGALTVGDSVRYSLRRMALLRLGNIDCAAAAGDRVFDAQLAARLGARLDAIVAPVLQVAGVAIARGGAVRVNEVQVLGVDDRFWALSPAHTPPGEELRADEAFINEPLARRLGVSAGEAITLRADRLEALPRDMAFAAGGAAEASFRLTVRAVLPDALFGRFSLRANQVAPCSVFVPREWLASRLGAAGRANLLVAAAGDGHTLDPAQADAAVRDAWQLGDVGVTLAVASNANCIELRSARIFIDDALADAALAAGAGAKGVLTYFVNECRAGTNATPYSFVAAPGAPLVPASMPDDAIVVNEWLARDLQAATGTTVVLSYYVLGPLRTLVETSATFRVASIVPLNGAARDSDLMPPFPGLAGAKNCRDWRPGIPVNLPAIRDVDEAYWRAYGGTPKAFVTLAAAQRLWRNPYGVLTAVRYPTGENTAGAVAHAVRARLSPGQFGLSFVPVRDQAMRAGSQSMDFGQLFMGLSFFIVAAALILTGMLFVFTAEQRAGESGTLLALGFRAAQVRRLLLAEGAVIAFAGSIAGSVAGVLYNAGVVACLRTVWRGAVGGAELASHATAGTVLAGWAGGFVTAVAALWLAARKQGRQSIPQLQAAGAAVAAAGARRGAALAAFEAAACAAGAVALIALTGADRGREAAAAFFAAGSLLLAAGVLALRALLSAAQTTRTVRQLTLLRLAARNNTRRPGRTLAVACVMACGVFLVIAVAANRQGTLTDPRNRAAGTGGFSLYGETALPLTHDLSTAAGRRALRLDDAALEGVSFVQLRMREGDDASCLNLNRAQQPRILGVNPDAFISRGSFSFEKAVHGATNVWALLNEPPGADAAGAVPVVNGVADQSVLQWNLGKNIGDTISYVDDQGRPFTIRIVGGMANSVFQGSILIADTAFARVFPSVGGSRVLLVDVPEGTEERAAAALTRALQDSGLDIEPAAERLALFNTVQNTYLSIFLALGGLGLLIGSVGLGIVVLRNVLERRNELALLRAVGFPAVAVRRLLVAEHAIMLGAGVAIGALAGGIAVLPAVATPGSELPAAWLAALLAAIVVNGIVWISVAARCAMRGSLLDALRSE